MNTFILIGENKAKIHLETVYVKWKKFHIAFIKTNAKQKSHKVTIRSKEKLILTSSTQHNATSYHWLFNSDHHVGFPVLLHWFHVWWKLCRTQEDKWLLWMFSTRRLSMLRKFWAFNTNKQETVYMVFILLDLYFLTSHW